MAKSASPKPLQVDLVREVLTVLSRERRQAHADNDAAVDVLKAAVAKVNRDNDAVAKAFDEATAALRLHERYRAALPKAEWDERARLLRKDLEDATATFDAAKEEAQKKIRPLQNKQAALAKKCQDLTAEWAVQVRWAHAAGLDVAQFWTPENPLEAEAGPAIADELAV